ncbi:trans-1,2-dihydrobenzene-1,2-diol dehydrogenase [Reticulomyxa filosa]|uniref:D-xylose 1-dehydrogenase (NADP(+), D-xylono-1,5-lactone-forming) n=1 Tax=Reticulomyxa filosa TaxID=46433 RepID=X6M5P8_RETFI|nr:trans-1,2-dihydrobenzene-1,2-diol dehydrogenase [Reticulomyxa filosa]|eukprot:ETO08936.1 trans-1,2-dihydrobenzene-1,2-diol dehydrogenase [Reticulomyxa filosa]
MSASQGQKKIYRWGIIGCGKISNDFALNLLKHDQCRLVACASRDQSAEEFAKKLGVKKAYRGYENLFADEEIDCVYVGTIHPTHKENVIKALKAGKHVVVEEKECDKESILNKYKKKKKRNQLGMNSKEMKECIAAARENKRYLLEGVWTRFFPAVQQSREWFNEGVIGELVCFEGNFGVQMESPSATSRLWTNHLGGGALLDLGIYTLHHLPLWFGERYPTRIVAAGLVGKKKKKIKIFRICGKHTFFSKKKKKNSQDFCHFAKID